MTVEIDPDSGFCAGVIRAIGTAEKLLAEGSHLYSLGAIVHNEEELRRLGARGLGTVAQDGLGSLPPSASVIIRAHGEPPATYERLQALGLKVTDCTCPVVLRLQKQVREAAGRAQVVIFGKIGHPEVLGLVGQTDGRALVVEDAAQLHDAVADGRLRLGDPIELFSQTTKSPEEYAGLGAALSELAGERLTVHRSICAQVASRHRKLAAFARGHDVIVFVSGESSSNGKVLWEWCRSINPRTYLVGAASQLQAGWFAGAASAGVCGATSTPRWLLEDVACAIENLH